MFTVSPFSLQAISFLWTSIVNRHLSPRRRKFCFFLTISGMVAFTFLLWAVLILLVPDTRSHFEKVEISSNAIFHDQMPFSRNFDVTECRLILDQPIGATDDNVDDVFYLPVANEQIEGKMRYMFLEIAADADVEEKIEWAKKGRLNAVYPTSYRLTKEIQERLKKQLNDFDETRPVILREKENWDLRAIGMLSLMMLLYVATTGYFFKEYLRSVKIDQAFHIKLREAQSRHIAPDTNYCRNTDSTWTPPAPLLPPSKKKGWAIQGLGLVLAFLLQIGLSEAFDPGDYFRMSPVWSTALLAAGLGGVIFASFRFSKYRTQHAAESRLPNKELQPNMEGFKLANHFKYHDEVISRLGMTAIGDFYAPQYCIEHRLFVSRCKNYFVEIGASSAESYVCICTVLNNGMCLRTDSLIKKSVGLVKDLTLINPNKSKLHIQGAKGLDLFKMLELHEAQVKSQLYSGALEVDINSDNAIDINHYASQLTARANDAQVAV